MNFPRLLLFDLMHLIKFNESSFESYPWLWQKLDQILIEKRQLFVFLSGHLECKPREVNQHLDQGYRKFFDTSQMDLVE